MIGNFMYNMWSWLVRVWQRVMSPVSAGITYFAAHPKTRKTLEFCALGALVFFIFYNALFGAPAHFPTNALVRIPKGATLEEAASMLKDKHYIHSANLLQIVARIYRNDGTIVAGEYAFTGPQNVLTIASRLTTGDFELVPVKIRVVEGMSVEQITTLLQKNLPDFDADAFYAIAKDNEGMLYPDTYFLLPGEEPELVLSAMKNNFSEHIHEVNVAAAIAAFAKPLHDVLVMASLLEKEASETQDRRIIAGILWQRIKNGMKLQVDAVFPYINGKNSFTLTKADLATDSPYNTYVYKGLPPTPIGSPSIDAILAAVTPLKTSYVYYLSDRQGNMHYATTYAQHLANKAKYLDN